MNRQQKSASRLRRCGMASEPLRAGDLRLLNKAQLIERVEELLVAEDLHVAEITRLREEVVTFCGPWAASYAKDFGLPDGHLHPTHYDILENAGARMDDFTRGAP